MKKKIFRPWDDKRILVFMIISAFLIPFFAISIGSIIMNMESKKYPSWVIVYFIVSIFVYICLVTLVSVVMLYRMTLLPEGVLLKKETLIIIPYKQISKIRSVYSKRDEQGNVIKRQSMYDSRSLTPKFYVEFVLNDGEIKRINADGFTKKTVIKIFEEIKKRALAYSDALKDFDPVSVVKKTKYTFKEPKESFINSNNLK